jgi:hypothetical protein
MNSFYWLGMLLWFPKKDVTRSRGCIGDWGQGAIGIGMWGRAITTWARIVLGVVRTIEVVLDDLVGSGDVDLIGIVDLGPIGNGEGRGDDEGG